MTGNEETYEHQNYCASGRDRLFANSVRLGSNAHVSSPGGETLSLLDIITDSSIVVPLSHALDLGPNLDILGQEKEFHTLGELVEDC